MKLLSEKLDHASLKVMPPQTQRHQSDTDTLRERNVCFDPIMGLLYDKIILCYLWKPNH